MRVFATIAIVAVCGCNKPNHVDEPQPPGSAVAIDATGTVVAGQQPSNLIIESGGQEYCLESPPIEVAAGDSVKFTGKTAAYLPWKGEHCMKLELETLEKQ